LEEFDTQPVDETISLLDYLIILLKRKRLILLITFACAATAAVISLRMPEIYKAEAKILRPSAKNAGMTSQLLSQFGGAAGAAASMFGLSSPNALYLELIRSRVVMNSIVEKFDLIKRYGAETIVGARKNLSANIVVRASTRSGIITIAVKDTDPEMAAGIANALVEELKKLTKKLAITEAAQRRAFFGEQLRDAEESLISSEEEMERFKMETGALKIDEQAKAVISAIANIKAKIAEKEVRLKVMRTYSTPSNPDLQKVEEALKGLRAELDKLETGHGKNYDPLMSTERMPKVGTEYVRKLREFKFSETVYSFFLEQYEAARLDEARDAVMIQVLDEAIPPEKRTTPKRTRMVILGAIGGFFLGVFMAFFMEYREKVLGDSGHREKLKTIRKYMH